MKRKSLAIGIAVTVLLALVSLLQQNMQISLYGSGGIGLAAFLYAGVTAGAFVNGHQYAHNVQQESRTERNKRMDISTAAFLFGLPNILAAIFVHLLS